ncbi:MAG: ATP-binding protein [Elusimicrobiota bacterium]
MLIRTKINLTLFIFISIIIVIGATYFYFSEKQVKLFNYTEDIVTCKEHLKNVSSIFSEQVQAYDYYLYLHEDSEKYTFTEKKDELQNLLSQTVNINIDGWDETKKEMVHLNTLFSNSLKIIEKYGRARAIRHTEREILPGINEIKQELQKIIVNIDKLLQSSRQRALSYKSKVRKISLILFSAAIIILSGLSINIYKTIAKPLRKVEKAAEILGKGNLDYKIDIGAENEFSDIADSFNKMTDDLKEFHIKVTQMGKMAAIGELAGGVAHEINNPLTGILGNVQMLLNKIEPESKTHGMLKKIERASIRCRDIVADLLDFSRKKKADIKPYSINKILDDTFLFCETEILSKKIEIVKKYSPGLPKIEVSPRSIQQAFLNIINNSIQAMPEGGKLVVSTKKTKLEGKDYIEIKFMDTGSGFDEETASHLFEPFFTTREVGDGTGLGLSLTYRIIRSHDGLISGESKGQGKGAIFTIHLPVKKK